MIKHNTNSNRNENKLRTYSKFRIRFEREKYLDKKEFSYRSTLAPFRTSAHRLDDIHILKLHLTSK